MNKNFSKKMMVIVTIVSAIGLVGCNNTNHSNQNSNINQNKIEKTSNLLSELNKAKEITVKEKFISFGAGYDIYADDKHVGEIQGKYINITGDVFELRDLNGNVVKSEKQIKRWNLKLNRMAEVYDKDKNVSGYIGEEKIKDMFDWGYKFHFYDKNKNEIGYTDQQIFSLTKTYKVYDLDKNLDYEIEGDFFTLKPSFEIDVHDNSNIPVEDVVFYTAIQNEIAKSDKAKSEKKKSAVGNVVKNVAVANVVNNTVNKVQNTSSKNNKKDLSNTKVVSSNDATLQSNKTSNSNSVNKSTSNNNVVLDLNKKDTSSSNNTYKNNTTSTSSSKKSSSSTSSKSSITKSRSSSRARRSR